MNGVSGSEHDDDDFQRPDDSSDENEGGLESPESSTTEMSDVEPLPINGSGDELPIIEWEPGATADTEPQLKEMPGVIEEGEGTPQTAHDRKDR